MAFQALPGFRDFYPEEYAFREYLFNIWRDSAQNAGFSFYDGPPLEPLDLYTAKSGEEIVHQLYNFTDKGEREVALRPEMTPTLARMAGKRHRDFKKPIKWCAIPQLFRYERAQRGRLREHFQWNCDIIGESNLGAEAELLAILVHSFRKLGLTKKDIIIRVSDRLFWKEFLEKHRVPEDQHYEFYQALDKMERDETALDKLGDLKKDVLAVFETNARNDRLDSLLQQTEALGISAFVETDLKIVRGLAYYTGIVFEVHDRERKFRAIAGGGRYDHLLKQISGQDLPAVGFGMGDVVIFELLKDKKLLPSCQPNIQYFIVIGEETYRPQALRLAGFLRQSGLSVDYPLSGMKFGKQFDLASERGATLALIVDSNVEHNRLLLKNMTTREQIEIQFENENGRYTFSPDLPIPCALCST